MAAIDTNGDGLCEIMDAEGLMGSVECWREFLSWGNVQFLAHFDSGIASRWEGGARPVPV